MSSTRMHGLNEKSELPDNRLGVKGANIGTDGGRSRLARRASMTMRCGELVSVATRGCTHARY
jgi:hypothetical protein